MQETLDFAIEANCEFANFYCAMAYPGSKLYMWPKKINGHAGDLSNRLDWIVSILMNVFRFNRDSLRSDVLKFRDNAFNAYFTNPPYLKMVRRKFDGKKVEHIQKMVSISLKRKLLGD